LPYAGSCLRHVKRSDKHAVHWLQKAAASPLHAAEYELGVCHAIGCGVHQDLVKAVRLLRLADHGGFEGAGTVAGALVRAFPHLTMHRCALPSCGKEQPPGTLFQVCPLCTCPEQDKARYCCKDHQRADWARHAQERHMAAQ
jgi:hypothetical protein